MVFAVPRATQVEPSAERKVVNELPDRVIRTHSGAVAAAVAFVEVAPFVTRERCSARLSPSSLWSAMANMLFAARESRIITPPMAAVAGHGLLMLATLAVRVPSPVSVVYRYWNWSVVVPMPVPSATMVYVGAE